MDDALDNFIARPYSNLQCYNPSRSFPTKITEARCFHNPEIRSILCSKVGQVTSVAKFAYLLFADADRVFSANFVAWCYGSGVGVE